MKAYKANVDLFYPVDSAVLRKLRAGENLPMRQRRMKHVPAGSVVTDIPRESVAVLLAKGQITEVEYGPEA